MWKRINIKRENEIECRCTTPSSNWKGNFVAALIAIISHGNCKKLRIIPMHTRIRAQFQFDSCRLWSVLCTIMLCAILKAERRARAHAHYLTEQRARYGENYTKAIKLKISNLKKKKTFSFYSFSNFSRFSNDNIKTKKSNSDLKEKVQLTFFTSTFSFQFAFT